MARDRPSPYGEKNAATHVGRGPSHATRACERVSLAMRLAERPRHPCRSGSPDPDPFGCRRTRTTELACTPPVGEKHLRLICCLQTKAGGLSCDRGTARDRPSPYGAARQGVSSTGKSRAARPGGLSYREIARGETGRFLLRPRHGEGQALALRCSKTGSLFYGEIARSETGRSLLLVGQEHLLLKPYPKLF